MARVKGEWKAVGIGAGTGAGSSGPRLLWSGRDMHTSLNHVPLRAMPRCRHSGCLNLTSCTFRGEPLGFRCKPSYATP